jgi:type III secretion protein L
MAFFIPRPSLTASRSLNVGLAPGTRVVKAEDLAAWVQAEQIVQHAREQAEQIEASAQAAYEAERERGLQEGRAQARLETAEQMMETVARSIDFFANIEAEMVELVMRAIRKIIDDYDDTERILLTVRNVLAVVRNQKQITLRLNPREVDSVQSRVNDLLSRFPAIGYIEIVPDARLLAGSCVLESDIGLVEASMHDQLTAIENAFTKILGSRI